MAPTLLPSFLPSFPFSSLWWQQCGISREEGEKGLSILQPRGERGGETGLWRIGRRRKEGKKEGRKEGALLSARSPHIWQYSSRKKKERESSAANWYLVMLKYGESGFFPMLLGFHSQEEEAISYTVWQ